MLEMQTYKRPDSDAPVPTGTFVPFNSKPLCGSRSNNVGWIVAANGCHLWCGVKHPKGYGYVRYGGRSRPAHIVRYEMEVGPVPEGMQLDHFACDTPSCCNPAHVRPASNRENTLRGQTVTSANAAKTHCPKGHPFSGSNLTVVGSGERAGHRRCRTCDRLREKCRVRKPR